MNKKDMDKILTIDVEATTFQKGNPYSDRNRLCLVGSKFLDGEYNSQKVEYDNEPYGEAIRSFEENVRHAEILAGFNIKYEFGWLRRYNINIPKGVQVFDCQLAAYITSRQRQKLPSLDECLIRENLGRKSTEIDKYWDNGINTDQIPWGELVSYNRSDVEQTEALFLRYWESPFRDLILASSYDILITSTAEFNGILWDREKAKEKILEIDQQVYELDQRLSEIYPNVPINWASPAQLSTVLFGGSIDEHYKEEYEFVYKRGGTALKRRNATKTHFMPRIIDPDPKTKLAAENQYSTEESVLQRLIQSKIPKKGRNIIELVLRRKGLEKLKGTYYGGYTNKLDNMDWTGNIIHSNFHHTITDTSRLSSSGPNIQNIPDEVRECVISRYDS